jgi:hypothetical protein
MSVHDTSIAVESIPTKQDGGVYTVLFMEIWQMTVDCEAKSLIRRAFRLSLPG